MRQSQNGHLGQGNSIRAVMDPEESRPACMPGKMKEDNLLPCIYGRGSQIDTSESGCGFRKEKTAPPTSCNSPIKLPNIQRSKSQSVPGCHADGKVHGHHRHRVDRRSVFEPSPHPMNKEVCKEQDEDLTSGQESVFETRPPQNSYRKGKEKKKAPSSDNSLRLPEILKDGFLTGSSNRTTPRDHTPRDSPLGMKRENTSLNLKIDLMKEVNYAKSETSVETQRSPNQSSALLLPLRNSETRAPTKGKKRRKGKKKNTETSSVYDSEDNLTARDDLRAWRFDLEQLSCSTLAEPGGIDFDEGRHMGHSDNRVIEKMSEENLMSAGHDCASSVERYKRRNHREFPQVKA